MGDCDCSGRRVYWFSPSRNSGTWHPSIWSSISPKRSHLANTGFMSRPTVRSFDCLRIVTPVHTQTHTHTHTTPHAHYHHLSLSFTHLDGLFLIELVKSQAKLANQPSSSRLHQGARVTRAGAEGSHRTSSACPSPHGFVNSDCQFRPVSKRTTKRVAKWVHLEARASRDGPKGRTGFSFVGCVLSTFGLLP